MIDIENVLFRLRLMHRFSDSHTAGFDDCNSLKDADQHHQRWVDWVNDLIADVQEAADKKSLDLRNEVAILQEVASKRSEHIETAVVPIIARLRVAYASTNDDQDYVEKMRALELWNSGRTWPEVAEEIRQDREQWRAVSEEVKRFAKKHNLFIRKGKSGSPKLHE
jgi:hypothetical protein